MDITQLSPEQKQALKAQFDAEDKQEQQRIAKERQQYKTIASNSVTEQIKKLANASSMLSLLKKDIYQTFATIIELKTELYDGKSGQMSHSFTDDEGNTITIGFRTVDKFDDTLDQGIAKVREYIDSLAADKNSAKAVRMLNNLLKKDAKGNLKPSRILDLQNQADELDAPQLFHEGITIIRESYKPVKSAIFIEAETVDVTGKKISIPLSITSVDFPAEYKPNLDVFK